MYEKLDLTSDNRIIHQAITYADTNKLSNRLLKLKIIMRLIRSMLAHDLIWVQLGVMVAQFMSMILVLLIGAEFFDKPITEMYMQKFKLSLLSINIVTSSLIHYLLINAKGLTLCRYLLKPIYRMLLNLTNLDAIVLDHMMEIQCDIYSVKEFNANYSRMPLSKNSYMSHPSAKCRIKAMDSGLVEINPVIDEITVEEFTNLHNLYKSKIRSIFYKKLNLFKTKIRVFNKQ